MWTYRPAVLAAAVLLAVAARAAAGWLPMWSALPVAAAVMLLAAAGIGAGRPSQRRSADRDRETAAAVGRPVRQRPLV